MSDVKATITTIDRGHIRSTEGAVLSGQFRHQGYPARYAVYVGDNVDGFGNDAVLSAQASVIQAAEYGDLGRAETVEVVEGDIIEVDGKLYEIRDDRSLADPRLVPVN